MDHELLLFFLEANPNAVGRLVGGILPNYIWDAGSGRTLMDYLEVTGRKALEEVLQDGFRLCLGVC